MSQTKRLAMLDRDKYLNEDEFRRLDYAARVRPHTNAVRDRALLNVAGLCGLRAGEAIALRYGDLFLADSPAQMRVTTEKQRCRGPKPIRHMLAIPASGVAILRRYLSTVEKDQRKPWDRVFPITRQNVWSIFKRYAKIAGINPRYTFHSLRHFRGFCAYKATKDPKLVQTLLRHARASSTEVYIHISNGLERGAAIDVERGDDA